MLVVTMLGAWRAMASGADLLDLSRLQSRLRDFDAIDWPQKMQLSADVEALKARIEARLSEEAAPALSDLHGHFNRLFDTVLAMLRDGDRSLHRDMLVSRNLVWATLNQREQATGN